MQLFSRFLRYFMTVGRLGSMRRSADVLNISASAIDRQILSIEADLGMPLFERMPTGLRLTAAGELVMAAGAKWEKDLDQLRTQIEDLRGLKRGHVEIAVIDALAKGFIPETVKAIQSRYPGITIGVRVLDNDTVRQAVVNAEVDFGIFFEPQSHRDLTVRAFVEVSLGFLTLPGHRFGQLERVNFTECAGSQLVVPAEPLAVAQQIAALESRSGLVLDRAVKSDNVQMITSLVLQEVGIGILSSLDVITEVERGLLSFTKISDSILRPMTLALCTATARTPSYAAGVVLGEIENGFSQLGYANGVQPQPA